MTELWPRVLLFQRALSPETCAQVISLFEQSPCKMPGYVGGTDSHRTYDPQIKCSTDLPMVGDEWLTLEKDVYTALTNALGHYIDYLVRECYFGGIPLVDMVDTGYHIQKYTRGQGQYAYHSDSYVYYAEKKERLFAYIFYLNDVHEGGETEFAAPVNLKVPPRAGQLLLFPPTWDFVHRGNVPLDTDKYIITGWVLNGCPDPTPCTTVP